MTTIHVNAMGYIGESGLTAIVTRRDTGAAVNGAGDAMSNVSGGHFTFELAEDVTGLGTLIVMIDDGSGDGDYFYLHEGDTECRESDTPGVDIDEIADLINSSISSCIVTAGVDVDVTGMPAYLRKQDARTEENGRSIQLRVYDTAEPPVLQLGSGSLLFADAQYIMFGLTLKDQETPEVEFAAQWVEDSDGDGYFLITYDEDALDDCSHLGESGYTYHNWWVKVQWPTTAQPITVVDGMLKIRPKIVSTV